ncbi:hypothetical protein OIU85_012627 [Salix viminalis]|uniref:Uncharacterized protein n=1 Tax=Salix viminalis TaxID=40686 RepID=A0A9Q0SE49_SALVM|nr:hypothetical protein OIU85_012627 [Salix viminalis]
MIVQRLKKLWNRPASSRLLGSVWHVTSKTLVENQSQRRAKRGKNGFHEGFCSCNNNTLLSLLKITTAIELRRIDVAIAQRDSISDVDFQLV